VFVMTVITRIRYTGAHYIGVYCNFGRAEEYLSLYGGLCYKGLPYPAFTVEQNEISWRLISSVEFSLIIPALERVIVISTLLGALKFYCCYD